MSNKLCGLQIGKFYEDSQSGEIYFIDTNRVVALSSDARLTPTRTVNRGLAGVFHQNEVDIREFKEVDPLKYLKRQRSNYNKLVDSVIRYHPSLQKEEPKLELSHA
jgi:hypothetical protein